MIEAVIFDMDGTLVDSEPLHHQAWRQTLADHGVPSFSWEQFLAYVGTSNEKVAEDFIAAASLEIRCSRAGASQTGALSGNDTAACRAAGGADGLAAFR